MKMGKLKIIKLLESRICEYQEEIQQLKRIIAVLKDKTKEVKKED